MNSAGEADPVTGLQLWSVDCAAAEPKSDDPASGTQKTTTIKRLVHGISLEMQM